MYTWKCCVHICHPYIISKINPCLAADAATLAPRAVPVPGQALIQRNQKNRMHLHKAIASKAKAPITAQRQSLELSMSLVANGTRILTYTASGDPAVPGRSPIDSPQVARATAIVARNLKRKGKYIREEPRFHTCLYIYALIDVASLDRLLRLPSQIFSRDVRLH